MFLHHPPDTPETQQFIADSAGGDYVNNFTHLWAWRPDIGAAFPRLRGALGSSSSLHKRELAVMACVTASTLRDSYCSLSFGTSLASASDAPTAAAVLKGDTPSALTAREAALAEWARKVVREPNSTQQQDVDRLRRCGLSDKEIFEATAFVAFRHAFALVNDALGVNPDWQMAEAAPSEVREAINYGRIPAARPQ